MTNSEHTMLMRGVAAGTLIGVTLGLMLALVISMKPEFFGRLVQYL